MRAPPESLIPTIGHPVLIARSITLQIFCAYTSPKDPPNTVKSCENTHTFLPETSPYPVITQSPKGRFSSNPKLYERCTR
jgi:hypothetical protein